MDYNFGNHDAYLFPEQSLGSQYKVDYLLVGFNSDSCNLVLVEFEDPNANFIISSYNSETEAVRKGISQIRDWRRWLDNHRSTFLMDFGLIQKGYDVPTTRTYYYLVVSKRDNMNEEARLLRNEISSGYTNMKIVTYDRLADNVEKLYGRNTW